MKYFYTISENKVEVFTSRLFDSIQEAVKSFMKEDAPQHYSNDTFTASPSGSYLHNELAADKRSYQTHGTDHKQYKPRIFVYFNQVNTETIPMASWREGFNEAMK